MNLINRKQTKSYIMQRIKDSRKGWICTQISKTALDTIEAKLRNIIDKGIHSHPTIGKTFKELI